MAISDSDINLLQSTAASSTGGAVSASGITSGVDNNLWADVSDSQRIAGGEMYRKVFWKNANGVDAALKPVLWASTLPTGGTLSYGLGHNDAGDDDPAQGNMTALGASAQVALVSDGADTRQATVWGMDDSGTPVPVSETVTLNGTTEVLTVGTFSKVWGVVAGTESASRTITVKQGSGGTTRGVIGPDQKCCWLWVVGPSTKAAGIALPDLAAGGHYGLWMRYAWSAGASVARPNNMGHTFEENA